MAKFKTVRDEQIMDCVTMMETPLHGDITSDLWADLCDGDATMRQVLCEGIRFTRKRKVKKSERGFTLYELFVSLFVVAVLGCFGVGMILILKILWNAAGM